MRLLRSFAFLLLLVPAAARADDGGTPPAEPPAKPAEPNGTQTPSAPPAEKPAETPPAAAPAEAKKVLPPKEAWEALLKETRTRGGKTLAVAAAEYLREWDAAGAAAEGADRIALGRIQAAGGKPELAVATWRAAFSDSAASDDLRDDARVAFVQAVAQRVSPKGAAKTDPLGELLPEAEAVVVEIRPAHREQRGLARNAIAMAQERVGRSKDALVSSMAAVVDRPSLAGAVANRVVGEAIDGAHTFEAYAAVRATGKPLVALLRAMFEAQLASAPAAPGTDDGAAWVRKALSATDASLDLLGNPLPDWTVRHSFRGGASPKDYAGKVVLVDFWATWCPWCIKSFPAMRDLRKEYGEKGFVVVGVTAPAGNVYEARYELDDDVKSKAAEGEKVVPLNLKRDASETEKAEFREKEVAAIEKFVANHEIPWDVVMIADEETSPRYGVTGWPTGILLDKKGRVRAIHSGALLRDKPESQAELRKRIEELLAEPD